MRRIALINAAALSAFLGLWGLSTEPAELGESIALADAAHLRGGASDGYFKATPAGCGGYSKVLPGGVQGRCANEDMGSPGSWLTGVWGSPGLTQTCLQCGVTCGSTTFIGAPTQGG